MLVILKGYCSKHFHHQGSYDFENKLLSYLENLIIGRKTYLFPSDFLMATLVLFSYK